MSRTMNYQSIKELLPTFLIGVVISVGMFLFGQTNSRANNPNEAEIGFAQDMSVHHQQAIEMSFLIRERTDNPAVRDFAFDIINTQANQRGMMLGWLDLWQQPPTATKKPMMWMADGMTAMNHGQMNGLFTTGAYMIGMATKVEMDQLAILEDGRAEIKFLELMIRHHQGGVMMAEGVIKRSNNETVTRLAQTMVNGQQAEIAYMNGLLKKYNNNL